MMCGRKVLLFVFLCCVCSGALHAEDLYRPVSDRELKRLEDYIQKSGQEKQTWLLQAQQSLEESTALKTEVSGLRNTVTGLQSSSLALLNQLQDQRDKTAAWETSYYAYVDETRLLLGEKERELTEQDRRINDLQVSLAKAGGRALVCMIIAGVLLLSWIGYIAIRALRFFKILPV
jgi:vacuolar-type H+-ATPase subunit I/STV1